MHYLRKSASNLPPRSSAQYRSREATSATWKALITALPGGGTERRGRRCTQAGSGWVWGSAAEAGRGAWRGVAATWQRGGAEAILARDARSSGLPRPPQAGSPRRTLRIPTPTRVCSFRIGARSDPGERGPGGDSRGGDGNGRAPGGRAGGGVWGLRAAGTPVGRAGSNPASLRPRPRLPGLHLPRVHGCPGPRTFPGPARPADVAQAAQTSQATRPSGAQRFLGSPRVSSAALQAPQPGPTPVIFSGSHVQDFLSQ